MRRTVWLSVAIAASVAAGCAAPGKSPQTTARYDCKASPCRVQVTVDDCNVSLDRDPLHIVKITEAEIVWDLVSPGYEFVADGIRFKHAPAGRQFHSKVAGPNLFKWTDRNTDKLRHEYGVKVKKTHGAACREHDPYVVNEP